MNSLLITVDQQIAASAAPDFPVQLPAIGRLRSRGVRMTHACTPHAQCSPARASLLTGLLPHAHGMLNNCHGSGQLCDNLSPKLWTYTRALRESGYRVGQVGKLHVSRTVDPHVYGFTDVIPAKGEKPDVVDAVAVKEPVAEGETLSAVGVGSEERFGEYRVAEETIALLRAYQQDDAPWHIRMEFSGPHVPWIVPQRFSELISDDDVKLPDNFYEDFTGKPTLQARQHRNANLCSCYHDEQWLKKNLVRYYGFVAFIDEQIGRVLDELESLGIRDQTMVIFTADHGELAGAHNRIGKGEFGYEELIRIPMIIDWPGVLEPGESDEFIMFHDLVPTLLHATGVTCPEGLHAREVVHPDGTITGRKSVLIEHHGTSQPILIRIFRDRRGKYVFNPFEKDEFYDLEHDPAELRNRIDDPEYEAVLQDYRNRMLVALREVDEKWYKAAHFFLSEIGRASEAAG